MTRIRASLTRLAVNLTVDPWVREAAEAALQEADDHNAVVTFGGLCLIEFREQTSPPLEAWPTCG